MMFRAVHGLFTIQIPERLMYSSNFSKDSRASPGISSIGCPERASSTAAAVRRRPSGSLTVVCFLVGFILIGFDKYKYRKNHAPKTTSFGFFLMTLKRRCMSSRLRVKSVYSGEGLREWHVMVPVVSSCAMISLMRTLFPNAMTQ